ncbi:MAG TPA: flavodoxin-dependent (E)-4-hydroxy-3-methylbut-2-enyl-diphosphate synthase [Dehalococcoidia bacterium]|nr:flavodoxin-dependent (E)-4-hydroxy-3-methylbut-2-enyl-diphosphate synthase [Dehalococcoidia bacterium]
MDEPLTPIRRVSKPVYVGDVQVGGDAPVRVQSMTNTDTANAEATIEQIAELADLGCEIVRIAVPDRQAAAAVPEIVQRSPVPLIADIHFDYRLALESIRGGIHGLRLNPGNIRDAEKVRAVVREAKERDIPIRIGVNAGSLPPIGWLDEGELPPPTWQRMVDAALWEIGILHEMDYDNIKISLKAFDVPTMVRAYRALAQQVPYPLHLGVTEAGTPRAGSVRSAIGIGILLAEGIGDTIRVSLAADPKEEVPVCWDILASLNLRQRGPTIVACPTCGRIEIDLIPLANQVEEYFGKRGYPLTVAVMGCVVNGPGEAKEADIGIAGGKGRGVIFRGGEVIRTVNEAEFLPALIEEGERIIAEKEGRELAPRSSTDDLILPVVPAPSGPRIGRGARLA